MLHGGNIGFIFTFYLHFWRAQFRSKTKVSNFGILECVCQMMIASFLRGEIKSPSRLSCHLQDRAQQANELNLKLATSPI